MVVFFADPGPYVVHQNGAGEQLAAVWQPSNTHSGTHGARIVSCFLSHGFSKVHEHIPTTSASQCRFRMVNNRSWSTSAALTSVCGQKMSVL